jgi:hypothetical protein
VYISTEAHNHSQQIFVDICTEAAVTNKEFQKEEEEEAKLHLCH